jgi:hypothetical protein
MRRVGGRVCSLRGLRIVYALRLALPAARMIVLT